MIELDIQKTNMVDNIAVVVSHPSDGHSPNDTLHTTLSKLHVLEAGLVAELDNVKCGEEIDLIAKVFNYGEAIFNNTEIEVVVNGVAVDTVNYDFSIPSLSEINVVITVTENLMPMDNEIMLNLLSVNGQADANPTHDHLVIEATEAFDLSNNFKIDIYNTLGKLMRSDSNLNFDSELRAVISLDQFAPGSYIVKYYNDGFEKYFKVMAQK